MKTLAWHETLELHEIVASTTYYLYKLKTNIKNITEPRLKELYTSSITRLDKNLRELLQFMSNITVGQRDTPNQLASEMYVEDLLSASKTLTKMYVHAITETATAELRDIFVKHLLSVIEWHTQVYNLLAKQGQYDAYNVKALLENDAKKATDVLNMTY